MDLKWENVSRDELEKLYYEKDMSDRQIADLYGISKKKVEYKRRKYGITFNKKIFKDFEEENYELFETLNRDSKARLCDKSNIDGIAKALTHYVFRNGPVEDMHSEGKLSESDMKTLNKYMVNRIAGILSAIEEGEWLKLELLYSFYRLYGTDWDAAEPDKEEMELIFQQLKKPL